MFVFVKISIGLITNTSDRNFILRCQIGIYYVEEMFVVGIVPSAPFLYPLKTRNLTVF